MFPVSVLGVRTSRESDWFVTGAKVDIKPSDQGVDEIIALSSQIERLRESQVRHFHCVEVDGEDWAWIRDQCFHLHSINQGLAEGVLLHGRVIETIDVVPDCFCQLSHM